MEERAQIQSHVEHTYRILHRVSGLRDVAEIAGSHHERLDGTGYWRGLAAPALSPAVRALVAADICEALMADRPYRKRLTAAQALELMRTDVGAGICPAAFEALERGESFMRLLELAGGAEGVKIFIGAENPLFGHAGCSVIVAPFRNSQERIVGALGVVGPTRINYARIVPMVDYTARVVGRLVG